MPRASPTTRSSDELIGRVLDAATYAPSAENRQPWEFVVVRDPDVREQIGDLTRRAWEQHGRAHSEGRLSPELLADVERGATGAISAAPGADRGRGRHVPLPPGHGPVVDLPRAPEPAARGRRARPGLRAHHDHHRVRRASSRDAVGLPESVVPVAVVPLGVPARPLGPSRRDPFAAHTHRDRYGSPWTT